MRENGVRAWAAGGREAVRYNRKQTAAVTFVSPPCDASVDFCGRRPRGHIIHDSVARVPSHVWLLGTLRALVHPRVPSGVGTNLVFFFSKAAGWKGWSAVFGPAPFSGPASPKEL